MVAGLWTRFTSLDSDSECDDSERKFDVQNSGTVLFRVHLRLFFKEKKVSMDSFYRIRIEAHESSTF